ncbi:Abscisic acid 8'-hydroxylase [Thalictrum thalictroides]|uniref:Abscisic acid 8'-hydroxylase n=1 Tax=Thalictrum thalictroides TaxID=46969 RepID=A0A7J6VNH8_THATH|nr:Abscisic acid 8'-hydroxylase [Thalictrum thalictroides]
MATVMSFTFREVVADVEYQGYCIPKGWKVLPLFRSIHHNPDFFTDPGKFNPSRFEWEIKGPSCFMENRTFLVIRLISGVIFQFWCSYITFPLYVIVTQMGSKFKKSVVAESVRDSLQGSYGSTLHYKSVERMKSIGKHSHLGAIGEVSDFQEILRYLNELMIHV